jgi:hypothetical protein
VILKPPISTLGGPFWVTADIESRTAHLPDRFSAIHIPRQTGLLFRRVFLAFHGLVHTMSRTLHPGIAQYWEFESLLFNMTRLKTLLTGACLALVCSCSTPNRLVYSSGFSFANYDFVVIGKPDANNTSTTLYGMDVEFSNLMSRYNFKVVGDKEFADMPADQKKRTLFARISMSAADKQIMLSVSFDNAVTGKTGSSITTYTKGNIFKTKYRDAAFESASVTIIQALQADKGLIIKDSKK